MPIIKHAEEQKAKNDQGTPEEKGIEGGKVVPNQI